jgi:uncharacterized repeat protein (TIGR03803 family)
MRSRVVNLVGALLSAAILAACSGGSSGLSSSTPISVAPQIAAPQSAAMALQRLGPSFARQRRASANYTSLYSFKGGKDGANAEPVLIDATGSLFGTTFAGGGPTCVGHDDDNAGCGTIFAVGTTGKNYKVLHRFPSNGKQGAYPIFGVIDANGILYGTTIYGGGSGCSEFGGCGTVFEALATGKGYKALYSFKGGSDGAESIDLTYAGGTLYGVTRLGGGGSCSTSDEPGCGTVFQVSPKSGSESVLHSFTAGSDGDYPVNVIDVNGELYGTTTAGGDTACTGPSGVGCGIVFRISTSGKGYDVLYQFTGGTDGNGPNNVIDVKGTLFGTTVIGGGSGCNGAGCGTLFELDPKSGKENILYTFQGGTDGAYANNLVTDENGTLYGTTAAGGGSGCGGGGCGTVFSISTAGKNYQVLYSFQGGNDGATPYNGLTDVNGTLYGTTWAGGGSGCGSSGCGTVFKLTL